MSRSSIQHNSVCTNKKAAYSVSQVNLRRLQLHAARDFTQAQLHAASENSDLLPVLVVQRQARKAKDYWNEGKLLGYDTVDVPHYIWIQKGTSVTPELVMDKIIASIRQSFDSDKRRESFDREIMDKFSDQRLICFGSSMYLDRTAVPFSAENPLLVCIEFQNDAPHVKFSNSL